MLVEKQNRHRYNHKACYHRVLFNNHFTLFFFPPSTPTESHVRASVLPFPSALATVTWASLLPLPLRILTRAVKEKEEETKLERKESLFYKLLSTEILLFKLQWETDLVWLHLEFYWFFSAGWQPNHTCSIISSGTCLCSPNYPRSKLLEFIPPYRHLPDRIKWLKQKLWRTCMSFRVRPSLEFQLYYL